MKTKSLAISLVLVMSVSACSTNGKKNAERPLTQQEASTLAQASFLNYDEGGALFDVTTVTEPNGPQLQLRGMVDWKTHSGSANVIANVPRSSLRSVWWQKDAMYERRPSLDPAIESVTGVRQPVLIRKPDISGRRLDQVVSVVVGLASQQAENAQLILQTSGSAYMRKDELRGRSVDVMRYGQRSIFWIDSESGHMMRFEGANKLGNQPILVDIVKHDEVTIQFPPKASWVVVEGNEQLLSLTSGF